MNDLVIKNAGSVQAAEDFISGLENTVKSGPIGGGSLPILKMDRDTGDLSFGEDSTPLEDDDVLAVDVHAILHGYRAFALTENNIAQTVDGDPAEFMEPLTADIDEIWESLPELEEEKVKKGRGHVMQQPEYKFSYDVPLVIIEGTNAGTQIIWKPTALGATSNIRKLLKEVLVRGKKGKSYIPVVQLSSSSYDHKQHGTIWKVDIEVLEFVKTFEIDDEGEEEVPETEVKKVTASSKSKKSSAKRNTKKAEPEPEDDDVIELDGDDYEEVEEVEETPRKTRSTRNKKPEPEEAEEIEEDDDVEEAPVRGRGRTPRKTRTTRKKAA